MDKWAKCADKQFLGGTSLALECEMILTSSAQSRQAGRLTLHLTGWKNQTGKQLCEGQEKLKLIVLVRM